MCRDARTGWKAKFDKGRIVDAVNALVEQVCGLNAAVPPARCVDCVSEVAVASRC